MGSAFVEIEGPFLSIQLELLHVVARVHRCVEFTHESAVGTRQHRPRASGRARALLSRALLSRGACPSSTAGRVPNIPAV